MSNRSDRPSKLLITRRHFFSRSSTGHRRGGAGFACSPKGIARGHGGCPDCRTLPPKAKRVIYCSSTARRRSWTCSITSPSWRSCAGLNLPDSVRRASGSPA